MAELIIRVAADAVLRAAAFVRKVATEFKSDGLSRLERADHTSKTLFGHIERGGRLLDAAGKLMPMPDDVVEKAYRYEFKVGAFGDTLDEAAAREVWFSWNSSVKEFAERVPKRKPKLMLLPRLRLIDLAYKVEGRSLT